MRFSTDDGRFGFVVTPLAGVRQQAHGEDEPGPGDEDRIRDERRDRPGRRRRPTENTDHDQEHRN